MIFPTKEQNAIAADLVLTRAKELLALYDTGKILVNNDYLEFESALISYIAGILVGDSLFYNRWELTYLVSQNKENVLFFCNETNYTDIKTIKEYLRKILRIAVDNEKIKSHNYT